MASNWRLITDDNATPAAGLAADEALAGRVGRGDSEPTLRLYTYQQCALVGRFQNISSELHLDYCQEHHIPVNRRPTGGGAILMGDGPLGVALSLPGYSDNGYSEARELMAHFSQGIVLGLKKLGIAANLRGKNDIEVDGRKIVGLGIYRAHSGGMLFHASILVDLNIPLMLRVLNTPFEKISDKEIAAFSSRITTVRRELDQPIAVDAVRQHIAQGYAEAFNLTLTPGDFTAAEQAEIAALEQSKYLTDAWIYQTTDVPDSVGAAKEKTPAGLLDVRATLAGRTLKAVYIGGDFFAAEQAIADLEASLRWHVADPDAIATTLADRYARWQDQLNNIPLASLVQAVQTAVFRAQPEAAE